MKIRRLLFLYLRLYTYATESQALTSQKNSFPLSPQNQEIHDTSSELLIARPLKYRCKMWGLH